METWRCLNWYLAKQMLKQGFSHIHCSVFKFTLRTFAVVFASYLKASVCPFSRYTLSILGLHSRGCPWEPQKCYCVLLFWSLTKSWIASQHLENFKRTHLFCLGTCTGSAQQDGSKLGCSQEVSSLLLESSQEVRCYSLRIGLPESCTLSEMVRTQLKIAPQRKRKLEFLSTEFLNHQLCDG